MPMLKNKRNPRHQRTLAAKAALWVFCLGLVWLVAGVAAATPSNYGLTKDGVFAVMDTTKGQIILRLYYKKTPLTVTNFVGLAEGTIKAPRAKQKLYYNGLTFHRVIANFMIQGGDPTGTGRGGPGYRFADEFHPSLKHDGPGVLSMANAGPGTNGSQFFITHRATPWLNNRHTVFGRVVKGMGVVNKIRRGDSIKTVVIVRNGADAKAFQPTQKTFDALRAGHQKRKAALAKKKVAAAAALIKRKFPKAKRSQDGYWYYIKKKGTGSQASHRGQIAKVHYTGWLLSGRKFDSSRDRGRPFKFPLGMRRVIRGWDLAVTDMRVGERRVIILPPHLAYGSRSMGRVIPAYSTLVFDIELLGLQ